MIQVIIITITHTKSRAPFEPLDEVDMKWVSLKLAVLLLLTTAARGS